MLPPFSDPGDRGQITVFLSLVFLLLMSTSFLMIEGIRQYMTGALCEDALEGAGGHVLANYDKPLFERYHIFFLDPREKRQIRQDGIDYLQAYCHESSFFGFTCRSLKVTGMDAATDQEGKILKHEIREWMKYRPPYRDDSVNRLREMYDSYSQAENDSYDLASELSRISDDGTLPVSTEDPSPDPSPEPSPEAIRWKSVKESLQVYLDSDLFFACLPSGAALSNLQADLSDLPSAGRKGLESGPGQDRIMPGAFDHVDTMASLFPKGQAAQGDETLLGEEKYIIGYIEDHFHFFKGKPDGEESAPTALEYEMEYIINGKDSDAKNIKGVFARIFHLRFLVNYTYARREKSLWEEAGLIAGGAAGQDGLPGDRKAGRLYLIGAAAYAQTVVDMKRLMAGKKVEMQPSDDTWMVSFENFSQLLQNANVAGGSSGDLAYEDYLKYFLMSEGLSRIRCYRMMDIMQMNVRLSEKDFLMEDSLFSFRWKAVLKSRKWFPVIPGFGLSVGPEMDLKWTKVNTY